MRGEDRLAVYAIRVHLPSAVTSKDYRGLTNCHWYKEETKTMTTSPVQKSSRRSHFCCAVRSNRSGSRTKWTHCNVVTNTIQDARYAITRILKTMNECNKQCNEADFLFERLTKIIRKKFSLDSNVIGSDGVQNSHISIPSHSLQSQIYVTSQGSRASARYWYRVAGLVAVLASYANPMPMVATIKEMAKKYFITIHKATSQHTACTSLAKAKTTISPASESHT